ncbi:deoxycytidylate deaminase [Salmonella phage CRW-SP2]|nr:deoxycytidylate deaminase [Salmonella phage CRW-SP2]
MCFKIKPRMVFAHMRAAAAYGATSYARRLQVGCVIVNENTDQPVAIGWNGTAPGAPNVCEKEVDGELVSEGVIHAEQNALARIPLSLRLVNEKLTMFVTHSPCPVCTKEIIDSGVVGKVVYREPYRITEGIEQMMRAGIEVFRMVDEYAVLRHVFTCCDKLGYECMFTHNDVDVEYIVAVGRGIGSQETGYRIVYSSDMKKFKNREDALRHGEYTIDSDDFNIGVIKNDELISLDWYYTVVTMEEKDLNKIAEDLGL